MGTLPRDRWSPNLPLAAWRCRVSLGLLLPLCPFRHRFPFAPLTLTLPFPMLRSSTWVVSSSDHSLGVGIGAWVRDLVRITSSIRENTAVRRVYHYWCASNGAVVLCSDVTMNEREVKVRLVSRCENLSVHSTEWLGCMLVACS